MTRTSGSEDPSKPVGGADHAHAAAPAWKVYEQALTLAAMGLHEEATENLCEVTAGAPDHAPAWQKLAELLRLAGNDEEARAASLRTRSGTAAWAPASDPRPVAEINAAERSLRERLSNVPVSQQREALHNQLRRHETDVAALRLLGILEWKDGEPLTARALFQRALVLAPAYEAARAQLALLLHKLGEDMNAVVESRRLVAEAPANTKYRALHADILRGLGDLENAIPLIEQLISEQPARPELRTTYAAALRYAGRAGDSAQALRAALALQPGMGRAYWGLAELQGNFLTDDDVAAIRDHLRDANQTLSSRMQLEYALGHALERRSDFAASFAAYEAGALLSREIADNSGEVYNQDSYAEGLRRLCAAFAAPLFAREVPAEKPDCTPIFVLGMPRAGSTLVEQILASHSLVEATLELPITDLIRRDLSLSRRLVTQDAYPECVSELTSSELAALGARYLELATFYRSTRSPYFIDKRPWNWLNAGLIGLILPHAKIVDVRREPMAAGFAMYKHMLTPLAPFSYDFNNIAHYYTQYVRMMAHYECAMPGRIHFLSYERLIEDSETEIRRLLDYCGLPFEEGCLRFWETDRVIATPSAAQVRRPIYRQALKQWRNFEPWLGPLKTALSSQARA
ncbi:MAG TPA: sulfotransferase [Rhizomicrobium sp.]|nr:sulfotransferase [Rhizomicrobium sp.]